MKRKIGLDIGLQRYANFTSPYFRELDDVKHMDTIIDPVVETVPVAEATPILVSQPKPQQSVDWTATFWRFARTFINTFIGIVVASAATSFAFFARG